LAEMLIHPERCTGKERCGTLEDRVRNAGEHVVKEGLRRTRGLKILHRCSQGHSECNPLGLGGKIERERSREGRGGRGKRTFRKPYSPDGNKEKKKEERFLKKKILRKGM